MIIWSGFGIVLLIAQLFTSCVGTAVLIVGLSSILGDKLAIFLSSLVGAGIAYYSMNFLRVKFSDKGKVMIDPKTGQPSLYKDRMAFFLLIVSIGK